MKIESNDFNRTSKLTTKQVESIQKLFIPSTIKTTESEQHRFDADSMQLDNPIDGYELITLDDGRIIYFDDDGYFTIKTNGTRQVHTEEQVKQMLQSKSTQTKGLTMKTETTTELTYKEWYQQMATKIEPEQIIKDFDLKAGCEIYVQSEREYQGKFYGASYVFKYESQILVVADILSKDKEYKIKSGLSDTALFMMVRNFVNEGQIDLPKVASRIIKETGNKVYTVKCLSGNYDIIINNDGLCTFAGKARASETEMRNHRLNQLANFRKNINDKRIEEEAKLCNQEYYPIAEKSVYDGSSIHE